MVTIRSSLGDASPGARAGCPARRERGVAARQALGRVCGGVAASALAMSLLAASAAQAAALPGATLESVRAGVLEANPELAAMALEVEAFAAREEPAGALSDPLFSIEWRDIDNDAPTLDPGAVGATAYEFEQRFPLWRKRALARDAARAVTRVADAERRARALELLARAEADYTRYWYAGAASAALDRIVTVLGDIERLATARYRTGLAPLQDPLKAQVELTLMQRERVELDALGDEAAAMLNAVLGRAPDALLAAPAGAPALTVPWTLQQVIEQVERAHPAVLGAAEAVDAAQSRRALTYRNRYPALTVSVAPIQIGERLATWDLMVGIEIPLQRSRRRAEEREALLMEQAAATRLEAVRNELRGRAGERYAQWQAADRQRALVEGTLLGQTEASYRAALASYRLGAVDFTSLLEALRLWRGAELARIETTRDALERAAGLRALMGSLLP